MSEPLKAGWPVFVENIFISVGLPAASDSYECVSTSRQVGKIENDSNITRFSTSLESKSFWTKCVCKSRNTSQQQIRRGCFEQ